MRCFQSPMAVDELMSGNSHLWSWMGHSKSSKPSCLRVGSNLLQGHYQPSKLQKTNILGGLCQPWPSYKQLYSPGNNGIKQQPQNIYAKNKADHLILHALECLHSNSFLFPSFLFFRFFIRGTNEPQEKTAQTVWLCDLVGYEYGYRYHI